MPLEATIARVRKIIIEQTGQDGDWVFPETKLLDIGDDLDRLEVVMACEESFGIDIPDRALETVATVGQLADLCEKRATGDGEVDF